MLRLSADLIRPNVHCPPRGGRRLVRRALQMARRAFDCRPHATITPARTSISVSNRVRICIACCGELILPAATAAPPAETVDAVLDGRVGSAIMDGWLAQAPSATSRPVQTRTRVFIVAAIIQPFRSTICDGLRVERTLPAIMGPVTPAEALKRVAMPDNWYHSPLGQEQCFPCRSRCRRGQASRRLIDAACVEHSGLRLSAG